MIICLYILFIKINDSGLKIFSIDDLQSAAEKSVQLSKVVKMGKQNVFTWLSSGSRNGILIVDLLTSNQRETLTSELNLL